MRFFSLLLVISFLLVGASAFAADGDLVVNGNIGVGTTTPGTNLDVNGGIRGGAITVSCSAALQGVMRWTGSRYEYCNNGTWTGMSGGVTWQMIWSTDITTATTSVTATGLNGDVDQEYKIIVRMINNGYSDDTLYVQPNGDSSISNYKRAYNYVTNGGTIGGSVGNPNIGGFWISEVGTSEGENDAFGMMILYAKSGRIRPAIGHVASFLGTGVPPSQYNWNGQWNNTTSIITSITFATNQINGIGVGTHIEIWAPR